MIEKYLDDLEARIDPGTEDRLLAEWTDFTEGRFTGDLFCPQRPHASPPTVEWPAVRVNEAIADFDRMALQQFCMCSASIESGNGQLLCVRSNYGTSILPSLFDVKLFVLDDEADTLPTSWPIADVDRLRGLVEAGVPDLHQSLAGKTLEMAARFEDIRRTYPKIGKYVHHYHPDLQGPMDICEVLWGSGLFLELVDQPDLVHGLLDLLTETYTRFLRAWLELAPFENGHAAHWGMQHKGHIMLRDDSAMNLSPAMFDAFIRPYDQRLLDAFGGGAVHFCGRGDHYIESMCAMRGMHAIAMSQPEYNDMETIYRHTVDRGIPLIGLQRSAAEAALAAGRDLRGRVQCWEPGGREKMGELK